MLTLSGITDLVIGAKDGGALVDIQGFVYTDFPALTVNGSRRRKILF